MKKIEYWCKWLLISELFFYLPPFLVLWTVFLWDINHLAVWYAVGHINSIPMGIAFREFVGLARIRKWLKLV